MLPYPSFGMRRESNVSFEGMVGIERAKEVAMKVFIGALVVGLLFFFALEGDEEDASLSPPLLLTLLVVDLEATEAVATFFLFRPHWRFFGFCCFACRFVPSD